VEQRAENYFQAVLSVFETLKDRRNKENNNAGAKKGQGRKEIGKKERKMRGGNNVRTPRVLNVILGFGTQ
jgi:hypothetical protein